TPGDMNEVSLTDLGSYHVDGSTDYDLPHLLHDKGLAASVAEARRLIKQGAVHVLEGPGEGTIQKLHVELAAGSVLRVGKRRFLKVVDTA
ncbi:MAG: hypothetical protein J4O04_05865, partial [Chloroflexi bacterium]|nr:hypothetical protein [Chloroflexota bacterium]